MQEYCEKNTILVYNLKTPIPFKKMRRIAIGFIGA